MSLPMTAVGLILMGICVSAAELRRDTLLECKEGDQIRQITSTNDWLLRRRQILEGMQEVMGALPGAEKRCPLEVKIQSEEDCGEFLRKSITYQSEPGDRVPAYLLVPKTFGADAKGFGVLALHQTHAKGNKVVVGLGDSPNDTYGVELARRGFVCLAPAYPLLADYAPDLKRLGWKSGTLKAVWNNIRGLDYLQSLPFVRTNGFAAIGHSLGGHNSLYTAVFDERIKVVVTSCGFDSFMDYMDGNIRGWTSDRYMPRLLDYTLDKLPFDFYEVLGAIAPRTVFISAPMGDSNFKQRSVAKVTQEAAKVYRLFGRQDQLVVRYPDVGHLFPPELRAESYKVIERALEQADLPK